MGAECCGGGGNKKILEPLKPGVIPAGSKETYYKLQGMDCADEVAAIGKALKHPQIFSFNANLMDESVTVYHDPTLALPEIENRIRSAGVKIVKEEATSFLSGHKNRIALIGASGVLLGIAMLAEWKQLMPESLVLGLFTISVLLSGSLVFPKALRALKSFSLDMNVLMTIAVVGAYFIKEYSEAATVTFLFAFAELLEALSVSRARKAIREVLKIAPKEAMVVVGENKTEARNVDSVAIGAIVLVRPGESVPLDGTIIEGSSSFNQAALTGESVPVEKNLGDTVLAGTLNELGVVKVKVTSPFKDSKVSKIISLIENAQKDRAPSQRFVDSFAKIYTPVILLLAIGTAVFVPLLLGQPSDVWIYRSLVLLVIGCPCALVIATPVSVVSGLTSLARRGVLVKGGAHLENLGKIRAIALDKTGTITEGKPRVLKVKNFSLKGDDDILKIASSLESMTTHPLAKAVIEFAQSKNVSPVKVENFKLVHGRGGEGTVEGHPYFVGNHAFAHELGVCTPELESYLSSLEVEGMSVIVVGHKIHDGCEGVVLAVFSVGDEVKEHAKAAIAELHGAGVREVVMISGDNQKTATTISKRVGIDTARGDLMPDDKVTVIKDLVGKHTYVGMVGDGVNDAPALANATVGIAMGIAGTDVAIETADVALMRDDLSELPKAIIHGKRVLHMIRFNIIFSIVIKVIFLVLAYLGYANLWMAVAADMGASLFVTFNALRLLR